MPRRLNSNEVREEFERYGYTLPENFRYRNNITPIEVYDEQTGTHQHLTLKQLRYRISHGRSEYEFPQLMNMALSNDETKRDSLRSGAVDPKGSFERFINKPDEFFRNESEEYKREVFNESKKLIKNLMKQQDFTLHNIKDISTFLNALLYSLEITGPKINKDIRMTIIDDEGRPQYLHGNKNTVDVLRKAFANERIIGDTNEVALEKMLFIKSIHFEFRDFKNGKRINPGFFPYINVSDIDLRKFGIFNDISDESVNESCLTQAFIASNILSINELKLLKSFIKTRTVPRSELHKISELLKIKIDVKIYYPETNKTSRKIFGEKYERIVKLIIIENHYMINEKLNVSEFYIKNYERINEEPRFKNHSRKTMLLKYDDKRYSFSKKCLGIRSLIYLMIKHKLLIPMNQKIINKLHWSFEQSKDKSFNSYKKIFIPDKKPLSPYAKKINQTKSFFGYVPEDNEVHLRLNEIQEVIDSLELRKKINISRYYKFSELMQKIMFEFGCFDNVYSFSGEIADKIRNELQFPKTFYNKIHLKRKLYYIDQCGAYMSSVKSIPSGLPDVNGNFNEENTKIKDLIEILYEKRMKAKENGNEKLSKTLKFMMNSCWGYSIQKPNLIKHKYVNDVNKYIETFAPYVLKYTYNDDQISGFVDTVNPYVEHFIYPQFARSVLNNFNQKMNELKEMVTVYYSKVDSALITEEDFNLLKNKGWIGNELGKFKIEHVFTEVYFKSAEIWIGKHEDGSYFYHCTPKIKDLCERSDDPIKKLMSMD